VERFVKTFGAADHPFHATRAELLRRSLLDGELIRWVSALQGGYPVEFYPFGAPLFEVTVWALLLGTLPMMAAHKIAVIIIFLLPAAGFMLLARADRLPLGVGLLALVFHISARGWWWSGGYFELVDWGLVSSSLAMASLVLFLPLSFLAFRRRSARWAALGGMVAAFAVYTNVRSFLPLGAVAVGMVASLCWEPDRRQRLRSKAIIALGIVAIGGLLAGPLLIAIARFNDLYFFVVYERYDTWAEYWHASIMAVSGPVFALAFVGLIAVFLFPDLVAGRFVAFTAIAHVAMTILLSNLAAGPNIEQLEAIRLMPFQRALTIYLAALGVYGILRFLARVATRYRPAIINLGLLGTIAATLWLYVFLDDSPIPASDRAMYPVLTTGDTYMYEQRAAVELADERAEPGTAILVLGSILSWHDQFWSIDWSDRPFFFNDWLWYWQKDHYGQYDPNIEHVYPDPASSLDPAYLRTHGIGAVVTSRALAPDAANSAELEPISQGPNYSVWLVRDPTPIITADGADTTNISIGNQAYSAEVSEPSSTFLVRRNWFPRWTATVDGQEATISKDENGYMVVTAEAPGTHVELTYGVDGWDWLGRWLLVLGLGVAAVAVVQPRRVESVLKIEPAAG
jgi:hypothetical protein